MEKKRDTANEKPHQAGGAWRLLGKRDETSAFGDQK